MEKKQNASKLISSLVALSLATTLGVPTIALAEENSSGDTTTPAAEQGADTPSAQSGEGETAPTTEAVAKIGNTSYSTLQDAISAAKNGDIVSLTSDITDFAGATIAENITIDFGEHTITGATGAIVLKIAAKVTLNSTPQGGINGGSGGDNVAVCVIDNGDVTINGGNYTVGGDASGQGNSTVYVVGSGKALINGGCFSSDKMYAGKYYVLNLNNSATGSILVQGGSFKGQDPSAGDDNKGGNFVAQGYTVLNKNGTYTVSGGPIKVKVDEATSSYPTLNTAIASLATNSTATLTLDGNIAQNEITSIEKGQSITLDLNGHTLTVPDCGITTYGSLTITDSQSQAGKLASSGIPIMAVGANGKFVLNSGYVESTGDYGVYAKEGGSATVNGGTITSVDAALTGNNTTGDMNFIVNGGTLTAKQGPAIYMPGQVNLTITDGTLNGGISLRMGQVNISGGTINAMTDEDTIDKPNGKVGNNPSYTYSGNVWFPDALFVIGGTYSSSNSSFGNSLNLTITGGTFNCENSLGSAVAIYDLGKVKQDMKASISGNAKLSTKANDRDAFQVLSFEDFGVENPASGYNNAEYIGKVDSSITGGTFSSDPSAYVADGYEAVQSGENWVVQVPYTPAPAPTTETTTTTNPDGTTTTTVTDKKTGESTATTEGDNGTTVVEKTDASGATTTEITVPADTAAAAEGPVEVPAAIEVAENQAVSVSAPAGTVVSIPVSDENAGNVAVIVHADGTEEPIPMSLVEDGKIVVKVDGNETIKVVNNAKDFEDVADEHWAADDIDFASSHAIFLGIANGSTYEPETALTRNMMMTVLARVDGADTEDSDPWYAKGQAWAVENEVSNGLRGEDNITREQLVTMLFNYANKAGLDTSARADLASYPDASGVSEWATDAVSWAVAEGILKGVNNTDIDPQGWATRAQAAAFMQRYVHAALL